MSRRPTDPVNDALRIGSAASSVEEIFAGSPQMSLFFYFFLEVVHRLGHHIIVVSHVGSL